MKTLSRLFSFLVACSIPQATFAQMARPIRTAAQAPFVNGLPAAPTVALPLSASALAPAVSALSAAPLAPLFSAPEQALPSVPTAIAAEKISTPGTAPKNKTVLTTVAKNWIGFLIKAVKDHSGVAFDASQSRAEKPLPIFGRLGVRELEPIQLPNKSSLDEQPTFPPSDQTPTIMVQHFALPGARRMDGLAETSHRILDVNPNNLDSVVAALKALVDANPQRYGVSSAELSLVNARKFEGHGDQADSIFVYFRQVKNGLTVHGATLSFTLKVLPRNDGKPMVVAQTGQLFPQIDVDTKSTLSDEQIMASIAERTGIPVNEVTDAFQFFEEKIVYSKGQWRHVKLYMADDLPFMIAVDMASGLVFAWDNRVGLKSGRQKKKAIKSGIGGTVSGRTIDHGPILPDATIADIPLAFLTLMIGGKAYTTDKDGRFSAPEKIPHGVMTLAAILSGPFAQVKDATGKNLAIHATLKSDETGMISVVFNRDATLNDENALAQVSAFHKVNLAYNFLHERGLTTDRMDKESIAIRTNVDDECNAYYTPGRPSLNFFRSSARCVNSAYDTVADHEYGHYWDDMTGGITNGGLSEGWGDTVSMYLLNNPIIGEHFLKIKRKGVDYLRHGENLYQYQESDEVHAQGQAWQGFTWKLRKALRQKLGDAAGAALAEALVLPTMFAKAATIPDAMTLVLVNAMKKDGTIQYEDLIRGTAKIHGVLLPESPKGSLANFVDRLIVPLRRVALAHRSPEPKKAGERVTLLEIFEALMSANNGHQTVRFTAGAMARQWIAEEIRRYLDESGLKDRFWFTETRRLGHTEFLLASTRPGPETQKILADVRQWLETLSESSRTPKGYAVDYSPITYVRAEEPSTFTKEMIEELKSFNPQYPPLKSLPNIDWSPVFKTLQEIPPLPDRNAQNAEAATLIATNPSANVRAAINFTVTPKSLSAWIHLREVESEIRSPLDKSGLKYTLHEYPDSRSTDFQIIIEGPQNQIRESLNAVRLMLKNL